MLVIRHLIIFLLALSYAENCFSQLQLTMGEQFLSGKAVRKIKVTPECHTVWALLNDGKVYYKKESDADFSVYPFTDGLSVTDLAGFNKDEMYFVVSQAQLIQVKNGTTATISMSFPGVSRINNIAAVHQHKDTGYYRFFSTVFNDDWIAIATNKHMYRLIRGTSVVKDQYKYSNPPFYNEPNWEITNDAYKSVDFRYRQPLGRCFDGDHMYHNSVGPTIYESVIPEVSPYPAKVNTTLFAFHWNQPFQMWSSFKFIYNYWGTDEGLFLKAFTAPCHELPMKLLDGQVINDLEELHALTPLYKQNYVLVGTDSGLWYTPATIFPEAESMGPTPNRMNFVKFASFPPGKLTSLCMDTKEYQSIDVGSGDTYTSVCEKVIWTATNNGVHKVYVSLDQSKFEGRILNTFSGPRLPVYDADKNAVFETCGSGIINIVLNLPDEFLSQLAIQWFKDGVEVPAMIGKKSVSLSENGIYRAKITSLCEGIYSWSVPMKIDNKQAPEITFNYPEEINLCQGQSTTLNTIQKTGYSYRWYKDNQIISGAGSSSYVVSQTGTYRVEASNCPAGFVSSASVKINVLELPAPIIKPDKNAYCKDEIAELRIDAVQPDLELQWFLDGAELTEHINKNSIQVRSPGKYTAIIKNASGCSKIAAAYDLKFEIPDDLKIISSKVLPVCHNESLQLQASTTGTYLWSTGETSSAINVSKSGVYSLKVINANGCEALAEITVDVLPAIVLTEPEEEKICTITSERLELRVESGYKYYTWNNEKTNTDVYTVTAPGKYTVQVEDVYGCTAQKVFAVKAWCKEVVIPNTFTPNGDGKNDLWAIGGLDDDNGVRILVYNREGQVVYEKTGCCVSWDGQYKGSALPVGTYYYILTSSASTSQLKGTVTILR